MNQIETASQKLNEFLDQFEEDEQERILRYALDHIVPKLKGKKTLAERWAKYRSNAPALDERAEEREACAEICDQAAANYFPAMREAANAAQHCASVIRARALD